jgi:hypothetical protein
VGWKCALILASACGRIDFDPPPLPECSAQRVMHLVAGNGGLKWFTLEWPLPAVIDSYQQTFAYDDPSRAIDVTDDPAHPLFARAWQTGHPTAFIAGTNETHTQQPISNMRSNGLELGAAAAAVQSGLGAPLPVLSFTGYSYGPAPGAPPLVTVVDLDGAIAALRAVIEVPPSLEAELRDVTAASSWYAPTARADVITLATDMMFGANLFKRGLVSQVIIEAIPDNPHMAFDLGFVTSGADDLAGVLDGFYRELAASPEPVCDHRGRAISLADNVVTLIHGDTPGDSFVASGWPDGTPSSANWMYVRANGYLRSGWFGDISTTEVLTRFDPISGALDASATRAADVDAAFAATLFAIARGNASAPDGLVAPVMP